MYIYMCVCMYVCMFVLQVNGCVGYDLTLIDDIHAVWDYSSRYNSNAAGKITE